MHIVHLIRRHFPDNNNAIIAVLVLLSASGIAIGIGLLLLN